jgi:integrase
MPADLLLRLLAALQGGLQRIAEEQVGFRMVSPVIPRNGIDGVLSPCGNTTNTIAEALTNRLLLKLVVDLKLAGVLTEDGAMYTVFAPPDAALRTKRSAIPSFDEAARLYIAAHRHEWKNAKHAGQWQATLDAYVSPVFGSMPVNQVDTPDVMRALADIWTEKTETATRVRGRIESVLDWARVAGYRTGENPARWRGHLEHSLATPTKAKKVVNHPALPWREIGDFMVDLRAQQGVAAKALQFGILTAARSGEVRMATWDEIDIATATWTIPASRMKAGVEHRVPLTDAVVELLRQMPRIEGCDWIFPGMKSKPLSDMSLTAVLRRMKRDNITVHGMRSSFRDWASESSASSFGREAAEHALAHSLPDKVEAAYRRGDQFERRVELMQAWADYCAKSSATAATVTPIRGAA